LIIYTYLIVEGNLTYFDSPGMMLNIKVYVTAKPWGSIREAPVYTSPGTSPIPAKSRLRGCHVLHRNEYRENACIKL
jgi:hypothetical protein